MKRRILALAVTCVCTAVLLSQARVQRATALERSAGQAASRTERPGQERAKRGRAGERHRPACGRDCAYLVLQMLGRKGTLDEVDEQLGHRAEVSLADLRRALEERGLHCRPVLLTPATAERIGTLLRQGPGRRTAIATLATDRPLGHFVVLVEASQSELVVVDAGPGTRHRVQFRHLRETRIPTLLVATEPWGPALAQERFGLPVRILTRAASSWWLSAGLAGAAILTAVLMLGRGVRRYLKGLRTWLAAPARRPWLARTGVVMGIFGVVGLTVWVVAPMVWRPIDVDVEVLDLGRLPIGSQHKAVLRLRNRSFLTEHRVSEVRVSCSCLVPRCQQPRLPPRGETTIEVDAWVRLAGPAEYVMLVNIGRGKHLLRVPIRFEGFEEASLSPREVSLGAVPRGMAWQKSLRLKVRNYRGPPINVRVATSEETHIVEAALRRGSLLQKNGRLVLQVRTPANLPLGVFSERLVLETIEETPRTFVVVVHADVVEPVHVLPRTLVLPAADTEMSASLRVQARFGELAIERAWADDAALSVEQSATRGTGFAEVLLRRGPGASAGKRKLYIGLKRPLEQVLEVPVYLSPVSAQHSAGL